MNIPNPTWRAAGRDWSAFQVCGGAGMLLGLSLATSLALWRGLSSLVIAGMAVVALVTFLSLAMVTKILSGSECLIYYHHEIATVGANALLLGLLHQPVLPYLDVFILGLGVFLMCGRVGCLMVGCCHGRFSGWGISYGPEHVSAGLDACYASRTMVPVQALESLTMLGVVAAGVWINRTGVPGAVLSWYATAYGLVRFSLEFLRGDADRPYFAGFSEAQWTSLALACVAASFSGHMAMQPWHIIAGGGMAAAMGGIALHRRHRAVPTHRLLHVRHIMEIAQALDAVNRAEGRIDVRPTSQGVRVSVGEIDRPEGRVFHCTLSMPDGMMTEGAARALGEVIARLKHLRLGFELVRGSAGVFHVVGAYSAEPWPRCQWRNG
jgi:prolipoprotein diacylglyceryltransferase